MSAPRFIPSPAEFSREAITVIGGAIIAALVIGNLPRLRDWIKSQWSGADSSPTLPWN